MIEVGGFGYSCGVFRRRTSILAIVWLVIGLILAANNGYLGAIKDLGSLISALLAILLWPLLLLGVDLNIK